ncbi:MAG: cytochrome c oxidase subunit 4 [Actinomycetota bacterium]|nr:cytochrome c oxidase subunit 4 [Actinomycetota bacterium]
MKIEARILFVMFVFGAIISTIYWFTSYEDGGTVMLAAVSLLGLLPGSYYFWWSRRMQPRPEDLPDANPQDSAAIIGAFPSSSIWPFVLGLGAAFVAIALVFGVWTAVFGGTLIVSAVIGVIMESRRGGAY